VTGVKATQRRRQLSTAVDGAVAAGPPGDLAPLRRGYRKDGQDLRAITTPSLIVSGAKDLPDFRIIAAKLTLLLPGARPTELPWAGHLPTLERPQEIVRDADRLLAGDRPGRVSH
jgi:pimeloyl-ACP methyl ester carboxylesterase